MTLVQFLRIIAQYARTILLLSVIPALLVFLLTMNQAKEFKNSTLIYTGIASTSDALGDGPVRIDNLAVNNSFDNLLNLISSREILLQTGLRLLAVHLVQTAPSNEIIGEDLFSILASTASPDFRDTYVVPNDPDSTFRRLWNDRSIVTVRRFTDNEKLPYCPEYIEANLKMKRAGSSDMLEMTYTSFDAAVTQQTLNIITGIFITEFKSLKSEDAQSLVKFFLEEARVANDRLMVITENLKQYRISNGIINYDEQTKQLTVEEMYMNAEYRDELRKFAASQASLENLNIKLGNRAERIMESQSIIDIRSQLTTAMSEKIIAESIDPNSPRSGQLKNTVTNLKEQLSSALTKLSRLVHTDEGTNIALLEQQWITQYINTVEGQVRLDVLKERRGEFRSRFNTFAPLGSSLHKYERDIDVAEKEYLELLHSLNLARLRQQNLEASTTIKVLDTPVLPMKAESSKRLLLLIGSWVVGLMLSIGGVIGLELLDRSIRTPERATIFSRLPVAAVFPDISRFSGSDEQRASLELIRKQTLRNIKLELAERKNNAAQHVIIVASMQRGEGKSTFAGEISMSLASSGISVALLTPDTLSDTIQAEQLQTIRYSIPSDFSGVRSYMDLLPKKKQRIADIVVIELPAMQENEIPVRLIEASQLFLYVMRADRIWRKSDTVLLNYLSKSNSSSIRAVVNGVQLERTEEFVGELPRQRSSVRKFIKQVAEFRLLKA
jgi:succinoglycan biosynthesis transport protein ExoP